MKKKFYPLLILAFLIRFTFSFLTWHPDVNNHIDWGNRFWEYGPKKFYSANVWSFTWPNQPPGTIYIYAGIKKIYDFIFSIFWWINLNIPVFPSNLIFLIEKYLYPSLLKLPSIFADFGIAYLIYKSIKNKKTAWVGAIVWLFNPVSWYNSSLWGQTDSLITFFVFLSFFLLIRNFFFWSVFSFALSIYIKTTLVIFIPIYLAIVIYKKLSIVKLLGFSFLVLVIFSFFTTPFSQGNPAIWLFELYRRKIFAQQLQVITANAFNIWTTIAGIHEKPHYLMLGPISYKSWGMILFTMSYLLIIWSFLKSPQKNIFFALSLVIFSSFMLLTNMHERYLFPLFPFFTILSVSEKRFFKIYLSMSFISLLNMYNFWWVPKLDFLVDFLSFGDRLTPRILGLIMFVIYLYLIKIFFRQTKSPRI